MSTQLGPTKDKDSQFTKNLLDASEKHNKNLSELIVILKKNVEEEKGKNTKLTKENGELKRYLQSKQLSLKKVEKELLISKQNEQKQSIQIKSLQDNLEKYRLQLLSFQQQKTKGDEIPQIGSGLSTHNIGALAERTSSISSLKYNNSTFFNSQLELRENMTQNAKLQNNTINNNQQENKQNQKDVNSPTPNNNYKSNLQNQNNNIDQKNNVKNQISKTPNPSEKENTVFVAGSKLSIDPTDPKRKQFYSIHQPSTTYSNQQSLVNNKITNNSFYQDALMNQQNISYQASQQQDTQQFQKPSNNIRGNSSSNASSYTYSTPQPSTTNLVNQTNINLYSKKDQSSSQFYGSKSQMQSKTNLSINEQNQQPQQSTHSRYASESFSQKYNKQTSKNLGGENSQNSSNIQGQGVSERNERSNSKKIENEIQTDYIPKNQGLNTVMNYLNNNGGQNTLFLNAGISTKNKKSDVSLTKENNQSDCEILLIHNTSQSQINPTLITKQNNDEKDSINTTKCDDFRLDQIKNGNNLTTDIDKIENNNILSQQKNRMIFQELSQLASPNLKQDYNNNNKYLSQNIGNTSIANQQIKSNLLNNNDNKRFTGEKLSVIQNKKKMEEQLKSPKFLQKDTIDSQFSKMNIGQQNQSVYKPTNAYIKTRHESFGNADGLLNQREKIQNEMANKYLDNNKLIFQNNQNISNPIDLIQQHSEGDNIRSLSNQGKTILYQTGKGKKDEDVTITVEDVLDTIANVEEDADEAANLENLSGSHFKFMMKTSCKNLRIKTEQYFSKIENPSLATFNKKKQEFQIQQQLQQQNLLPSFGQLSDNYQCPYNYISTESNYANNIYDPYNQQNNNNLLYTNQIMMDDLKGNSNPLSQYRHKFDVKPIYETASRLNTEEVSRSICEKHQSVEIYNQINNKMTNFKSITYDTNITMVSPRVGAANLPAEQIKIENVLERKIKNKYSIHEKKEPGKMKKYLDENQINDIGNRIFEGLMIYGPDKNEIKNLKSSQSKEVISLSPQLYFKYPENSQIEKGREDVFQQFAFPFGVETQQISLTDSLSQLNEIIFSNNMAEANNNCFVFAVKSEQSYKFQKNKDGPYKQNEHQELLEICNPSNLLYGICFRVKEVLENGQNKNCWTTNKLFCFLTYYPFHRFFLDIISSMLNQMKMKRIEYFSKIQENIRHDPAVLSKLENEFFYNFLNKECKILLDELKNIALPSLSNRLSLNFNGESFAYLVPNRESAKHIEAEWGCSLVLSSFDKELFVNIFLSLLLEQSVVFVSSNSALLSSTMLLFHSLLKPFKWHHPLIFNLPNNFTHLMDIPVPILLGLNKDKNYVYQNNLSQKHENCLFVLLDDDIEILNFDLISHISQSYCYQDLLDKVSNLFEDLEKDGMDDANNINYQNQSDSTTNNMSNSQNSTYKEILSHSNNNTNNNNSSSSHANNNSGLNNNNSNLSSNIKKNNSIFSHGRSKSFIVNATDAFNSLIGSKNKTSKVLSANSQHQLNSNSTHRRKKTIIAYPNIQEKKACMQILSTCTNFLTQDIISSMPILPPYQLNSSMLNFDEIEKQMVQNFGKDDIFIRNLTKTQLFAVFAEEKYELTNI